jgi:hypothetical protein
MKKTDIAMIVLIAGVCMVIAFFGTRAIFGDFTGEDTKVKTIDPINAEVADPNPEIFNEDAINPAVEVQVGSGSN